MCMSEWTLDGNRRNLHRMVWSSLCYFFNFAGPDLYVSVALSLLNFLAVTLSASNENKALYYPKKAIFSSKARIVSHGLCYSMVCVLWQLQVFIQLKPSSEGWILGMQRDGTSVSTWYDRRECQRSPHARDLSSPRPPGIKERRSQQPIPRGRLTSGTTVHRWRKIIDCPLQN